MKTNYMIVLHNGDMEGDCSEYEYGVKEYKGITIKNVRSEMLTPKFMADYLGMSLPEYKKAQKDPESFVHEELEFMDTKEIVGAWVVPIAKHKKIIKGLEYAPDCGNDSSTYAMQSLLKGLWKAFAIATIGKKAKS